MTDVLEVLLELECLQKDLARHPLKEASEVQYMMLVGLLQSIMGTITKSIISKDCLAHLEAIGNGDMT